MKIVRIDEETHRLIKAGAGMAGTTTGEYVTSLVRANRGYKPSEQATPAVEAEEISSSSKGYCREHGMDKMYCLLMKHKNSNR